MKNYVELIGLCIKVSDEYLDLELESKEVYRIHFGKQNLSLETVVNLNVMTRVIGHLSINGEDDYVILGDRVYQLNGIVQ